MQCEWDERKDRSNRRKHGISFEFAEMAFDDPFAITREDYQDEIGETRFHTLGLADGVMLLLVAHVYRMKQAEVVVRIISARKANKHEEEVYWSYRGPY
jgi:uncharacterized protein